MGEITIRADNLLEIIVVGVIAIIIAFILARRRVEVWIRKERAVRRDQDHPGENSEEE